jgi:hypothetical protein
MFSNFLLHIIKTGSLIRSLHGLADVGHRESAGTMWKIHVVYQSKALKKTNPSTLLVCIDGSCGNHESCLCRCINTRDVRAKKL